MYANELKIKEKQKLTEIKKLTATYNTSQMVKNALRNSKLKFIIFIAIFCYYVKVFQNSFKV